MKYYLFYTLLLFIFLPFGVFAGSNILTKNGDLIKGSDAKIYLIQNGQKRWIVDEEVFLGLGYKWRDIKIVRSDILNNLANGKIINNSETDIAYSDGTFLLDTKGRVYLLENGLRRWVPPSEKLFKKIGFNKGTAIKISDDKLNLIPVGKIVRLVEAPAVTKNSTFMIKTVGPGLVIKQTRVIVPLDTFIATTQNHFEVGTVTIKYGGTDANILNELLSYSTFLDGVDKEWTAFAKDTERKIELDGTRGSAYTFSVRAKNLKGEIDSTPAVLKFVLNISPFYKKIKINDVTLSEKNVIREKISLRNDSDKPISISSWTLEGKRKSKIIIPKIERIPLISFMGGDFILPPSRSVDLISAINPITNREGGFQINRCVGYLNRIYKIEPELRNDCPLPERQSLDSFSTECQRFMRDVNRCTSPTIKQSISQDSQCTGYILEHFNYTGCVKDYQLVKDFFIDEWRIYLGHPNDIWDDLAETIILKDSDGLLVDQYSEYSF